MKGAKMFQHLLLKFLATVAILVLAKAQSNPSGFTNIDCGIPANSSYVDSHIGLTYVSDASYIATGVIKKVAPEYSTNLVSQQLANVRAFPEGARNCYNISLIQGNKYLVRATFYYGNYDGLNKPPVFDLYLGASKWANVQIPNVTTVITKEIKHVPSLNYIFACLVNLGTGTPFISALEVRELVNPAAYVTPSGVSLVQFLRYDIGSGTNKTIRYPYDVYDRIWYPYHSYRWTDIIINQTIDAQDHNDFQLPSLVMSSATTPNNANEPIYFNIYTEDPTVELFVYMHFAELQKLHANQSRHFNIYVNNQFFYGPVTPGYLYTDTVYGSRASSGGKCTIGVYEDDNSTLPPLWNAIEIYYAVNDTLLTDQGDVYAMMSIKSTYGIARNWQGDPCAPQAYAWDGLSCSYTNDTPPVVTSLDLSSSQLTGQIARDIANLKNLQNLDLSNNGLTGSVPSFLSQLPSLVVLNLAGNNLTGAIPDSLLARSENGSLSLSVPGNPNLCPSISCYTKKKSKSNAVVIVVIPVVVLLVLAVALAVIFWNRKKKRQPANTTNEPLESKNRQLTYLEIVKITNNFERVIGNGAFGTVYHGYLDNTPVAVKMLSPSSAQGYKEFQAEVKLLLRVHHKNLTSLVGYCNEGANLGLIYEYMANGNLDILLSENSRNVLSWEGRLQIAVEAAQGLEYLHNGCMPPIVHRDIKTTNILLNEEFHAKLADFGLSRAFPIESGSHISTIIAGTPGYLDPEYYITDKITEKSDVYSFGVVLLKILSGQPVFARTPNRTHISAWVGSILEKGDIKSIVDPRVYGDFDISSAWKMVEVAMACVSTTSSKRPTMTQVVTELNECLAAEMARKGTIIQLMNSSNLLSTQLHTGLFPLVR